MPVDLLKVFKERRSYYHLDREEIVSRKRILEMVEETVKYTPYAFNSQSGRVIVLFGEHSDQMWEFVIDSLKTVLPPDTFVNVEKKIRSFSNGMGTILFYEDMDVTKGLQEKFPLYKDNFPFWAEQANGSMQLVLWMLFEAEGLGASSQHYLPLVEGKIKEQWNVADSWKLIGEMPFGKPAKDPDFKSFLPLEPRIRVFE